ncbi:hypothetical protein H9Y04_09115 [Streptomyces sp. TRM66268-LWL]|uniref:Ig-like domain repeat protein n=1 Tax=Streptomyces polyasparticus TaxID=2767826 RepID=A0ABR7SB67_9ACTN|nr:hypothetical protein [Streptomyces polyasparticus]MBC9712731.1 hypothetical protein [Streptomyces polyasparticus]
MRGSRRILSATFAAALGSALLAIPGTAPAYAATGVSLPLYQLADMEVDGSHRKIFLSMPAGADGRVVVSDYNGNSTWLSGLPGAGGLALSPDEQTLYVAARDIDTIVAYDTATLAETARYHVGDGIAPWGVAVAGGKLWFGYGVSGDLGSIDIGAAEPVVALGLDSSLDFGAELVASPADPNVLVVGTGDPNRNTLTVYDVSSGSPVMTKRRVLSGTEMNGLRDIDVTPDGRSILTAALISPGYRAFRIDDLSDVATHAAPSPASPVAVAAGPDGIVAGATENTSADVPDVSVYAPVASAPLTSVEVGAATQAPVVRGLAWAPDGSRLFTVTKESGVMGLRLHSLPVATPVHTTIALDAPATSRKRQALTLTGTLTPGIAPGTTVTVTRHDASDPEGVSLGSVPVAADGTFTATDAPAKPGAVRYVVAYGGDRWHTASSAEATVEITRS